MSTDEIVNATSLHWLTAGAHRAPGDEEVQVRASCDSLMLSIRNVYGAPAGQLGLPACVVGVMPPDEPPATSGPATIAETTAREQEGAGRTRFGGELMGAWWAHYT